MKRFILTLGLVFLSVPLFAGTKLLRQPDIHNNTVVFSYANDLWLSGVDVNAPARRLTSHIGIERFAKFSPDGKKIAFTGQYGGDDQVYIIDVAGGEPTQLTWYPTKGPLPTRWGVDHQVYGWSPDGKSVLFRSMRDVHETGRLYSVSTDKGTPKALPMPYAGSGDYSPDGLSIVYSPLNRDFRSWKRYEGGWAQNLYTYNLADNTARQISTHKRTERDPMWLGDSIYFVSDRDDTLELFRVSANGGKAEQLTHHKRIDLKWASSDNVSKIVYELNGDLAMFDVETSKETVLSIQVNDDGVNKRVSTINAASYIDSAAPAPKGGGAVFSARGSVFAVPKEHGLTRNLTPNTVAHAREVAWSPDGSNVAYVSDANGEEQLYIVGRDGSDSRQLATFNKARLYKPVWSPNNDRLLVHDHMGNLWSVTVKGKKRLVANNAMQVIDSYNWAPDGQWITYSAQSNGGNYAVYLWSYAHGKSIPVSDTRFDSYNGSFSPDGSLLYFISNREFAPQLGQFEWNYVANRSAGIFAVALNSSSKNPFSLRDDLQTGKTPDEEEKDKSVLVNVNEHNIISRLIRVPIDNDNIDNIWVADNKLFYTRSNAEYYGRNNGDTALKSFDFKSREASTLAEVAYDVTFTADKKHVLLNTDGSYQLLATEGDAKPTAIDTSNMRITRRVADEWPVIFNEVWRRFRDYFYVRNMHGYDWEKLRAQYTALLGDVSSREDLNVLLSEMISELNVGHAYVQDGDHPSPQRSSVALLGARFEYDDDASLFCFSHIFAGQNAEPRYRSPLTEVGVDIEVGDYLLAINGIKLSSVNNPYALLTNISGNEVELLISDSASQKGSRRVRVRPLRSEGNLVYSQWVESRRATVDKRSDGKLGYLHIPDMGERGIYEFVKWYYPQLRKQALVIDVRGNGGGNVSSMLLQRLMKKPLAFGYQAHSDWIETYPYGAFNGPMAALISETSASDGDIFPYFFRELGLGPLIGKQTWGGIVGITNNGPLLDGGLVFVPEFGLGDSNSNWIIEGKGVTPDIEIQNEPAMRGDLQLNTAIDHLLDTLKKSQSTYSKKPKEPNKNY